MVLFGLLFLGLNSDLKPFEVLGVYYLAVFLITDLGEKDLDLVGAINDEVCFLWLWFWFLLVLFLKELLWLSVTDGVIRA